MPKKLDIFATLAKKQESEVLIPKGEITFQDQIELSAQSSPLTGLAKLIGKTKSGNFRYVMTCEQGHFKFYSKEELNSTQIDSHPFGIQQVDNGTLYWY
jgi:hypothetical protein